MSKQTGRTGGFIALNRGEVTNCCSLMKIKTRKNITGGVAGENAGEISSSYYSGTASGLNGGVTGIGKGSVNQSYFFHGEPKDSKRLENLHDTVLAKRFDSVAKPEDAQELGFDTQEHWEYIGGSQVLMFNSEKWFFDVEKAPSYLRYLKKAPVLVGAGTDEIESEFRVTSISTPEELLEFATKINAGDSEFTGAYIRLEEDIDLAGKAWVPIGNEPAKAFKGLFDGNGHTIKNFVVKADSGSAKGLFGYLKGEVYNLNVDCAIKGGNGSTAGAIAAYNDGGVIGCCGALADIQGKGGNLGGLAGSNTGTIFHSYAAGTISSGVIPWVWLAPLPLLLALLLLLPGLLDENLGIFAPIPLDADIVPIGGAIDPREGRNFVTFQFEREIDVNLATSQGLFNFVNPGTSNHNIVVQLHFTDAQAMQIMGSTGRLEEDQQRLRDNPQYDPKNHRTVIAQSGAIPPGYQLENLQLTTHPNGATVPPGQHNAIVYLIFYDIHTNNRAMMESQFPVTINVHSEG